MRRKTRLPPPEAARRVEDLLRAAADYTPDDAMPRDLAARALARRRACPAVPRRQRLALAAGLAAVAAVSVLLRVQNAGQDARIETPVGQPVVATVPTPLRPPDPVKPVEKPVTPRIAVRQGTKPPPRRLAVSPEPARRKRPVRRMAAHRPRETAVSALPHWETKTVQQDTYGMVAPAWLAHEDSETGETILTPVLVDVPLSSDSGEAALPSSDESYLMLINTSQEETE